MLNIENGETMATQKTAMISNYNNNVLDPSIAMELAYIRQKIEDIKRTLSDFVDEKYEVTTVKTEDLETAVCEQSKMVESRFTDIEVALCELSESVVATIQKE